MKTIILGDTHGRSFWKLIVQKEKPNRVIFVGDYFDSFDIPAVEQMHNFKEIIQYKLDNSDVEVILLIGNHDHHYFPEVGYSGTSNYQAGAAPAINMLLDENREHMQMAYQFDNFLITHAGVGLTFLKENGWKAPQSIVEFLNDLWKHKPKAFEFNGWDPYGDNIGQTPIWIRPKSLMADGQKLKKDYIQVVGHTGMPRIDREGKATGGRYYFIDTLGRSREYMIVEDGVISFDAI